MDSARVLMLWVLALGGACTPPVPAPPSTTLEVDASAGTFSLTRGGIGLTGVRPRVLIDGAEQVPAAGPATVETADAEDALGVARETRLTYAAGAFAVTTTLRQLGNGVFTARVSVACAGACASPLPAVQGLALAGTATAPTEVGEPTSVLSHGYQSWSPTFLATVQRTSDDEASFENTGNNEQHLVSDAKVSWWVSFLSYPGAAVVSGALTSDQWKSRVVTYRRDGVQWRLSSGRNGDQLPLGPTRPEVSSETFFLGVFDTPQVGLTRYGDAVATLNPRPAEPFIPVGWNSWNTLFADVTEAKVLANASALAANVPGLTPNTVQIDDGWEKEWGDWTANAKFPSGMQGVASRLTAQGLNPGLWMAPLLVDSAASIASAHPDWFVRTAAGAYVSYGGFNGRIRYVLDSTNPAARDWLLTQLRNAIAQGYRYLKLDYLYAGACEGVRFDREATSLSAFRSLMKQVFREAQASGVYILACGAPVLPTAGVAHGIRTGEDIAASNTPYAFTWVKNAMRNVAFRFFVNRFLVSDPDTALIRGLPLNEQRLQLTASLLAGRLYGLGDDLEGLSASDSELLARASGLPWPSQGTEVSATEGFVPMDYLVKPQAASMNKLEILTDAESYQAPSIWRQTLADGGVLVALLNWSSDERTFSLSLADLNTPSATSATELWTDTVLKASGGKLEQLVPAHGAALLRIQPGHQKI